METNWQGYDVVALEAKPVIINCEWINYFKNNGFTLNHLSERVLVRERMRLNIKKEYKVVAFTWGSMVEIPIRKLYQKANENGLIVPPIGITCSLRANLSDEDLKRMGIYRLVIMHEPINLDGDPLFLTIDKGKELGVQAADYREGYAEGNRDHGMPWQYHYAFIEK
jgi:hypothetical protein